MAHDKRIDTFIQIDKEKSTQVHLQIQKGDILSTDTDALVVFREADGRSSGDSLRVLDTAGQIVEDEYQQVKSQGGKDVNKGVVQTTAGNLKQLKLKYILHLQVENNLPKFRETVSTALKIADKLEVKAITFPSLPDVLRTCDFIEAIFEVFKQFTHVYRPFSLHFIQVVILQSSDLVQYANPKHDEEYGLYHCYATGIKKYEKGHEYGIVCTWESK